MFRKLADTFYASPQIGPAEIVEAAALGVRLIVNNRLDGEAPDEPQGDEIENAARAAGLDYVAIPITHAGFSLPQLEALQTALNRADGPVLAYCRSGTRSTLLWALAEAHAGADPAMLSEAAAAAGYDVGPVRAIMDAFAAAPR